MSGSRVVYGWEYDRLVDLGGLDPARFKYRFLAEGDSWMERSSALTASLPHYLAEAMDAAGDSVLIVNLAMFGDTMRRIGECIQGEFGLWIRGWKADAILLSAGGNDFIDAARDPPPGQGLLKDLAGQPAPANGQDCIDPAALSMLVNSYLNPNFAVLYDAVQASVNRDVPIFLNNYDTPVARDAPAFPGGKAWLFEAYRKNSIPPALWGDLTKIIFGDVQKAIAGWAQGRANVIGVPTHGRLTAADPADSGNSGDWINEIHPNKAGWRKLAPIWRNTIRARI